jgi:hypothetical protein
MRLLRRLGWPSPSLAVVKDTWFGALNFGDFFPPSILIDEKDCTVHREVPKGLQKPMGNLVDAFLYLGPKDLALKEQLPAYILLDTDYTTEVQRRESLLGGGWTPSPKEFDQQFVKDAENPLYPEPELPDPKSVQANVQSCLDRKGHSNTPKAEHNE